MTSGATRLHGLAPPSSRNDTGGVARALETDEAAAGIGLPGTTIANYQLVKQIGEGGMGRVFEVWHPQLHKSFALRLLVKQLEQDHGAIERFQSETLALGRVEHVNVVSAIDAGTWQGRPFLVTQLLQGTDLATHVGNHGPLGLEQTVPLTIQIARGIQAAHAMGLYHRDIKPSNLFLENNGTVKLLDFGLVRSETCESLTIYSVYPKMNYDYNALSQCTQATPVNVVFRVQVNAELILEKTVTMIVRPVNDCPLKVQVGDQVYDRSFTYATFVNEQHPDTDKLLREALDIGVVEQFDG
jgi:serine/threonine protein kinase